MCLVVDPTVEARLDVAVQKVVPRFMPDGKPDTTPIALYYVDEDRPVPFMADQTSVHIGLQDHAPNEEPLSFCNTVGVDGRTPRLEESIDIQQLMLFQKLTSSFVR